MVITGVDKGKTGKVLRVLLDKNRVVVEGLNRVWKHVRPSQRNPFHVVVPVSIMYRLDVVP